MQIDLVELFTIDKKPKKNLIRRVGKFFTEYEKADDRYLILNHSWVHFKFFYFFMFFISLFFSIIVLFSSKGKDVYGALLFMNKINLYLIVLPTLLLRFLYGKKKIIFDRIDHTITYYYPYFSRKTTTSSFGDLHFGLKTKGDSAGSENDVLYLFFEREGSKGDLILQKGNIVNYDAVNWKKNQPIIHEFTNMLWWYMDKNRPLPPCRVFDPYRERDYERRKKEGFPEPLIHSSIETPDIR